MSLSCEHCEKIFKTVSALNAHQKNTKYCLIKQGKIENIKVEIFECLYCKKILSSKQNLNSHTSICDIKIKENSQNKDLEITKLKEEIIKLQEHKEQNIKIQQEYKEQIKELQNKIERMATKAIEKPTSNTTNLFLSPIDLIQEHITKMIQEKFTKEHFYDGQAGVARFAVDNILKDKDGKLGYICTDPARQIFKHITSDGEVKKDVRASKLTKKLVKDVKKVSGDIVLKKMKETNESTEFKKFDKDVSLNFLTKKMDEIAVIEDDNSKFRAELANLTVEK